MNGGEVLTTKTNIFMRLPRFEIFPFFLSILMQNKEFSALCVFTRYKYTQGIMKYFRTTPYCKGIHFAPEQYKICAIYTESKLAMAIRQQRSISTDVDYYADAKVQLCQPHKMNLTHTRLAFVQIS